MNVLIENYATTGAEGHLCGDATFENRKKYRFVIIGLCLEDFDAAKAVIAQAEKENA